MKNQTDRLTVLGKKGLELGLRTAGQAPEQRQARRLVENLDIVPGHDATKVMFISPRNWSMHAVFEGMLATALRLRGADVHFVNCGGGLDICDRSNTSKAPPMPCKTCTRYSGTTISAFGNTHTTLRSGWEPVDPGEWNELSTMSTDEMAELTFDGLDLGALMDIPVKWFLLAARLEEDPLGPQTMRAFLTSARRVAVGFRAAIKQWRPDTVFMLNGLFFFESIARAICEEEGIDVVTYERSHREDSLIFARNRAANRFDFDGIWATRGAHPLTDEENAELDQLLTGRRRKGHPLLNLWANAVEERPDRPVNGRLVTLFSNVTWDSAVIGRDYAFDSMHAWLEATIDYFAQKPEHRLIIRAHPVETKRPGMVTREQITPFIRNYMPDLPDNIVILGPDDPTSSYPLMEESDIGLVYTSTVGMEMSAIGKPVVVAGQAHYRDRGFTTNAETPEHYVEILDRLLADPSAATTDLSLARRYIYAFFFDAPIRLPFIQEPTLGLARLATESLDDLSPGANSELDLVCEAILQTSGTEAENTYFLPRR